MLHEQRTIAVSDPLLQKIGRVHSIFAIQIPHCWLFVNYAVTLDVILDASWVWKMSSSSVPMGKAD